MNTQNLNDHDVLIRTATLVEEIHERLFGDGETGELPKIKSDIDDLKSFKHYLIGGWGLLCFCVTALGVILGIHVRSH